MLRGRLGLGLLAVLVVAIMGPYVALEREVRTLDASTREALGGSYVALPGGVTHYELSGPDQGAVVVLVHGGTIPFYAWDPQVTALREAGLRVLRYDHFGRGYSDRPQVDYDRALYQQQLEDLRGTSGQASERLTRLTTETERASSTLREWVGEAMRVQVRLDKSLKQCPSISETHPSDSLEEISQIAQPLPRIANRSALDMPNTTQEPKATYEHLQLAAPGRSDAPSPHAKAEEIAQLIREAKNGAKLSRT